MDNTITFVFLCDLFRPADPERIGHVPPVSTKTESQKGVESKTARAVLSLLAQGSHGKAEIARALGKPKPGRHLNERVVKLLRQHLIERTLPDKPNSRLQRYRLTPLGHTILAALNKK